jgi:hypothetical protein
VITLVILLAVTIALIAYAAGVYNGLGSLRENIKVIAQRCGFLPAYLLEFSNEEKRDIDVAALFRA